MEIRSTTTISMGHSSIKLESSVSDSRETLARLIQYTRGEAKDLVKMFIQEQSDECYKNALRALDREYGHHGRVASAFMNQLRQWPSVRGSESKPFTDFS